MNEIQPITPEPVVDESDQTPIALDGSRFVEVISGQFDADEEIGDAAPPKRVLAPQTESPKLHKVLAQSGLGSRLEMEQLILEGRISVAPFPIGNLSLIGNGATDIRRPNFCQQ